ncbi:MAG: PilW family protein [Pseudomonadota bacterium]|nr:PilW family protein [Pseudomonadota bacterium]
MNAPRHSLQAIRAERLGFERQRGLTLIELMVGMVIGVVLSLAAASLYLATRESSRSSQSISDVNETGKIALDMIGREIQKAGFYPAQFGTTSVLSNYAGAYYNGKPGANVRFNSGIFGCAGAKYLPATSTCAATAAGQPDTIIVNYFATPEFGADSLLGNTNDCNRKPVADDADNALRVGANMPLFVSNRFGIVDGESFVDSDRNTVTAKSLGCHGNGDEAQTAAQRALEGVEDLVIRYGIYRAGLTQSPEGFLTATQVNAEVPFVVDGRTAWQRVVAVSVCVVVRSTINTRQDDKPGQVRTYRNCRGATPDLPAGNRYIYKSFERVYAVRNNLSGIL